MVFLLENLHKWFTAGHYVLFTSTVYEKCLGKVMKFHGNTFESGLGLVKEYEKAWCTVHSCCNILGVNT